MMVKCGHCSTEIYSLTVNSNMYKNVQLYDEFYFKVF